MFISREKSFFLKWLMPNLKELFIQDVLLTPDTITFFWTHGFYLTKLELSTILQGSDDLL